MPSYPNYSQDIRSLIASMLVEPIDKRPTAWQVHQQVCRLRGTKPNKDYVSLLCIHTLLDWTDLLFRSNTRVWTFISPPVTLASTEPSRQALARDPPLVQAAYLLDLVQYKVAQLRQACKTSLAFRR